MAARHATPKKSNRKTKQVIRTTQRFSAEPAYEAAEQSPRPTPVSSRLAARSARLRSTIQAVSTDYHYVANDLKKIAITAGALIIIMIALTFVVR